MFVGFDPNRPPVVDVVLVLRPSVFVGADWPKLNIELLEEVAGSANVDLLASVFDGVLKIDAGWVFDVKLNGWLV